MDLGIDVAGTNVVAGGGGCTVHSWDVWLPSLGV